MMKTYSTERDYADKEWLRKSCGAFQIIPAEYAGGIVAWLVLMLLIMRDVAR